jgi:hypothetical protein
MLLPTSTTSDPALSRINILIDIERYSWSVVSLGHSNELHDCPCNEDDTGERHRDLAWVSGRA